ncbi:hypothetical protein [Sphingosinicella rhizophila]|uniref:Uncharacterized protein n=1 Tax=Sphingosinicella rhizophila TaxID=3050082 RepID=A0ABU3Q716_9SPHN|nr:hypothetical protein [Sphingosinicella sp. GR2756]MDT9599189.1 hypothetical protein [Sphingosinicella sp. GR2756]
MTGSTRLNLCHSRYASLALHRIPLAAADTGSVPCYCSGMITESYYWKKPLLTGANFIRKYMDEENITDAQFARIEREIFIGFYTVRKLLEATGKVSPETRDLQVSLKRYPKRNGQPLVDWYNRSEFWELYDLEDGRSEQRDLLYVAHQMVHSFIFVLSGHDDGHGAFFTSDRDRKARLSFIATSEIARIFEIVGNDYPSGFNAWRDPDTGEMKWAVPLRKESAA